MLGHHGMVMAIEDHILAERRKALKQVISMRATERQMITRGSKTNQKRLTLGKFSKYCHGKGDAQKYLLCYVIVPLTAKPDR